MAAKKKTKKDKDDSVLKVRLDRHYNASTNTRKELDWKWFMYDLWVSGNHYAKWDKNTQQILTTNRDKGRPKVVINKTYTTLRGVRNFVLRNRPRAEVTPDNLTEETIEETKKLNRYLDFLHEKLRLRRKLKATVWHALKYSVGFWQVMWDEDADDGQGEVAVNVIDPYDLYWDPVARDPMEARYCILAVRRNVEELKKDPKYDFENMAGDDKLAASSLKARLLQAEKGMNTFNENSKDSGTIIVREHWYKETIEVEKEDENGQKVKVKEPKIMLAAIAGDKLIREPEDTGLDRFPFFRLQADVEPLSMYGTGWVKNLIPVNRLLDRLESNVAEYNDIMNKGKWVADKGSGVRVINNENGQIIEKKRGFDVNQQPIAPLSAAVFQQIENANRYLEDIGGAHDASLGRIPPGAKSGKALEALQVGDSNNMSEVVENVEEFLEDVYEYVLHLAAQKYQFARNITPMTRTGEREFITVIGEEAGEERIPNEALVLNSKNTVDVKITSWLAHTAEARREVLKELYQLQAIDRETLLEGYSIGNVADVLDKVKKEQLEQAATNIEVGKQEQIAEGEAQQAAQPQEQGASVTEAIAAIRMILNGQVPEPPANPTPAYVGYIDQFLQSPEAQELDQNILQAIQVFRDSIAAGGQPQGGGGYVNKRYRYES